MRTSGLNLVFPTVIAICLARPNCIYTYVLIAICLAWSYITQLLTTNKSALSDLDEMLVKFLSPHSEYVDGSPYNPFS